MKQGNDDRDPKRRSLIHKALASCPLCSFSKQQTTVSETTSGSTTGSDRSGNKHKFERDSGMSYQEVFDFTFKETYIPVMRNLQDQIGHERFLQMLKEASVKMHDKENLAVESNERTLKTWVANVKLGIENYGQRISAEVATETATSFELIFSECIWAKTFREANASDIGYAGICYQDYGMVKAFNPKLELIREKTLMEGDDCCHFKFTLKE